MTEIPISVSMLNAMKVQTELFALIYEYAPQMTSEILGKPSEVQNSFWRTIRYRSVLLTFDVDEQVAVDNRKYPYGWQIHYQLPTELIFAEKLRNTGEWKTRLSLDLEQQFYFQILDSEKQKIISDFVRQSISSIKLNRA